MLLTPQFRWIHRNHGDRPRNFGLCRTLVGARRGPHSDSYPYVLPHFLSRYDGENPAWEGVRHRTCTIKGSLRPAKDADRVDIQEPEVRIGSGIGETDITQVEAGGRLSPAGESTV